MKDMKRMKGFKEKLQKTLSFMRFMVKFFVFTEIRETYSCPITPSITIST